MNRVALWSTVVAVLLSTAGSWSLADEHDAAAKEAADDAPYLRYGERALRGDDFRASPPDERPDVETPIYAYSETMVRYRINHQVIRSRGQVRVLASNIEIYAIFVKDKSWNIKPNDPKLLDHHQGHFDLAQIAALELDVALKEAMRTERQDFVGVGKTEQEAQQDLLMKVEKRITPRIAELEHEHRYFDLDTRYGTLESIERERRDKQKEKLAKLQAQLEPALPRR